MGYWCKHRRQGLRRRESVYRAATRVPDLFLLSTVLFSDMFYSPSLNLDSTKDTAFQGAVLSMDCDVGLAAGYRVGARPFKLLCSGRCLWNQPELVFVIRSSQRL